MSNSGFKLEHLFGSKTRARLMGVFLDHPQEAFFVRELTRRIDAQLNSVRRELKNLLDVGLLVEKETKRAIKKTTALSEKKRYYCVNTNFLLFEDLRSLFKKVHILLKKNLVQEIERQGTVDYLVFTGNFVDRDDIQTDMLIVGRVQEKALQGVISKFEIDSAHEVNYTMMTKEEFLYRKQVSDRFLLSILEGKKVVMVNKLGL